MENLTSVELAKSILAEIRRELPQIVGGVVLPGGGVVAGGCGCDGYCGCNANCGCEGKGGCGCNANCPCDTKSVGGWRDWIVDPPPDVMISVLARFLSFSSEQQTKVMDAVPILAEKQKR